MIYSPIHNQFLIKQEELQRFSRLLLNAMKHGRKVANLPLGKRESSTLQPIDYLEKNLLDAARAIGVDFGVEWGEDLDLTDIDK